MMENVCKYDFGGFKYELHSDCFDEIAYYITPDGKRQELPVYAYPMTAMDAIKIHAMNLSGYSP